MANREYYKTPEETLEWLNKHLTPELLERGKVYGECLRKAAENRKNEPLTKQDFYNGCRRLSDELDLEMFFHDTAAAAENYFVIHRSKPRPVLDGDKYVMLPFSAPEPPVS